MNPKRFVIIGDGAAGLTAARHLRDRSPLASITLVCDDPQPGYFRAALTNYLLGELADTQIWATSPTFFQDYRLERRLGRVASVDARQRHVHLADGGIYPYDELLVASGAHARPAPFEGAQLGGVKTFRTLYDARGMLDMIAAGSVKNAVVVGGGPLAIEWAMALGEHGVKATMLVRGQRVMDREIDPVGSDLVVARMRRAGIEVRLGEEVHAAQPGRRGAVASVTTKRGESLPCQLLCVAIGVVPNTYFLHGSGVNVSQRGSIVVDDHMRTNVGGIYAAGDVIEHHGQTLQLWEPAKRQALVAASNMTGDARTMKRSAFYFATRLADLDFASVGEIHDGPPREALTRQSSTKGEVAYQKLLVEGGHLVGAMMLGQRSARVRRSGRAFKRMIDERVDVGSIKEALLDPSFDLESWLRGRALVMTPPPPASASAASAQKPANIRGTQAVRMQGGGAPAAAVGTPQKRRGKQLSIGLPAAGGHHQAQATETRARLEGAGQTWPLAVDVVVIGRGSTCDVVVQSEAVSQAHAQIVESNGNHFLRDLGSSNGTWVNRELVSVPRHLTSGDEIHIADTALRYVRDGGGAAAHHAPAPKVTVPTLEVRRGPALGLRFALEAQSATIGRDDAVELRLDDSRVSRRHAVLTRQGDSWYVADLQSRHGTFKNGTQLRPGEEVPLQEGDQLAIGESLLVLVHG